MKTYIIAECACAHQGNPALAKRLIDVAVAARCDAVKSQVFKPELIPNLSERERKYLDKVQPSYRMLEMMRDYCGDRIEFILTPFDIPSVTDIMELQLDKIKVPSGRLLDKPFIEAIKATGKQMIISTGLCDYEEIRLNKRHMPKGTKWLHCVTSYPLHYSDCNLSVLRGKMFDGLSDHTISTVVPSIAVAMGAKIIEKHFTLRRTLPGPDMKVSLEPIELVDMVRGIRDVEDMMGDGKKKIEECEQEMIHRKVVEETKDE